MVECLHSGTCELHFALVELDKMHLCLYQNHRKRSLLWFMFINHHSFSGYKDYLLRIFALF